MIAVLLAGFVTFIATGIIRRWAVRRGLVDSPASAPERKVHRRAVPLLGGLAIFLGFFSAVWYAATAGGQLPGQFILAKHLWALGLGGALLMIGGFLDDRFRLPAGQQVVWPIAAGLVAILGGVGIDLVTNPFGGVVRLDEVRWTIFTWQNVGYQLTLWADLLTFAWLMGMMYTTKFLDGLDGLVSGVTVIGSLAVFLVSVRPPVLQSDTALLSAILAAACFGFLLWNWHPAKIFLGEGGSLLTGYLLGSLAIIAGSKIATALLIMGIPILDVAWVIFRRAFIEKRSPFRTADRKHLHFRLLDIGLSHRGAVIALYALTAVTSATTLIFHGVEKVIALLILGLMMAVGGGLLVRAVRRRSVSP